MALESLFSGNALHAVDAEGGLVLPGFVLRTLARRSESRRVLFSPHETDPCVTAHDEAHGGRLFAEAERRRLREEDLGLAPDAHHRRMRRAFGAAEAASYDARGRILLPEAVRRRAQLEDRALIVGTGGGFEIWDPGVARASDDEALRELADFVLAGGGGEQQQEEVKA